MTETTNETQAEEKKSKKLAAGILERYKDGKLEKLGTAYLKRSHTSNYMVIKIRAGFTATDGEFLLLYPQGNEIFLTMRKELIKTLMEVGYKNLFIIVIIPDFANLDRYIRTHRVNSLLKAERYYDPGRQEIVRGLFKCYGRKKIRRIKTKVGSDQVSYPRPDFFEWCPNLYDTPYAHIWKDYKAAEPVRKDTNIREHMMEAEKAWKYQHRESQSSGEY